MTLTLSCSSSRVRRVKLWSKGNAMQRPNWVPKLLWSWLFVEEPLLIPKSAYGEPDKPWPRKAEVKMTTPSMPAVKAAPAAKAVPRMPSLPMPYHSSLAQMQQRRDEGEADRLYLENQRAAATAAALLLAEEEARALRRRNDDDQQSVLITPDAGLSTWLAPSPSPEPVCQAPEPVPAPCYEPAPSPAPSYSYSCDSPSSLPEPGPSPSDSGGSWGTD
jgi:hypothetical protein